MTLKQAEKVLLNDDSSLDDILKAQEVLNKKHKDIHKKTTNNSGYEKFKIKEKEDFILKQELRKFWKID